MRSVKEILADVQQQLDEKVNPALEGHGGKADALDFNDQTGEVRLLMSGGCSGCAGATYTLQMQVEGLLKHYIPEITSVVGVDNEADNNPYYKEGEFPSGDGY